MQVIPDEGKSVKPNKKSNSSEFMYHKLDDKTTICAYDSVLNALNKLDTLYIMTMQRMHGTSIKVK